MQRRWMITKVTWKCFLLFTSACKALACAASFLVLSNSFSSSWTRSLFFCTQKHIVIILEVNKKKENQQNTRRSVSNVSLRTLSSLACLSQSSSELASFWFLASSRPTRAFASFSTSSISEVSVSWRTITDKFFYFRFGQKNYGTSESDPAINPTNSV